MMSYLKRVICSLLVLTLTMTALPDIGIKTYADTVSTKHVHLEQIIKNSSDKNKYDLLFLFNEEGNLGSQDLETKVKKYQERAISVLEKAKAEGKVESYQSFFTSNSINAVFNDIEVVKEIVNLEEIVDVSSNDVIELIDPVDDIEGQNRSVLYTPDDRNIEWGVKAVHAEKVWDEFGLHGEGVTIGIIDTGVNYKLPALKNAYKGYDPVMDTFDTTYYKDFIDSSKTEPDASPENNHGTHVAGIIVGKEGDSLNQIGVAPGAKFISARAIYQNSTAKRTTVLAAGDWMYEMHPDIINNSWGGNTEPDPWFMRMAERLEEAGIIVVFASGNDKNNDAQEGSILNPASLPNVISVGAVDINNKIAPFSNKGPSSFDKNSSWIKPEFTAPGVQVRSLNAMGGYTSESGTSMAAPHVSGVLALIKQAKPDITMSEAKSLLTSTAQPLTDRNYTTSPNMAYGYGIVNAYDAIATLHGRQMGSIYGTVLKSGIRNMQAYNEIALSSLNVINSLPYSDKNEKRIDDTLDISPIKGSLINANTKFSIDITKKDSNTNSNETDLNLVSIEISNSNSESRGWETVGYFDLDRDLELNKTVHREYSLSDFLDENVKDDTYVYLRIVRSATNKDSSKIFIQKISLFDSENSESEDTDNQIKDTSQSNDILAQSIANEDISKDSNLEEASESNFFEKSEKIGETKPTAKEEIASLEAPSIDNQDILNSISEISTSSNSMSESETSTESKVSTEIVTKKSTDSTNSLNYEKTSGDFLNEEDDDDIEVQSGKQPISLQSLNSKIPFKPMIKVLNSGKTVFASEFNGEFKLTHAINNPNEPLKVEVSAYGYETKVINVDLTKMKDQRFDFVLDPAPLAKASGKVLDESQNPIVGVKASIIEDDYIEEISSDDNGKYRIKAAYAGDYTIRYSKYGYLTKLMRVELKEGDNEIEDVILNKLNNLSESSVDYGIPKQISGQTESLTESNYLPLGAAVRFQAPNTGGILKQANIYLAQDNTYRGKFIQVGVLGYDSQGRLRELAPFKEYELDKPGWHTFDFSEYYINSNNPIYITTRYDTTTSNSIAVAYVRNLSNESYSNSFIFSSSGALNPVSSFNNIPQGGFAITTDWFFGSTSNSGNSNNKGKLIPSVPEKETKKIKPNIDEESKPLPTQPRRNSGSDSGSKGGKGYLKQYGVDSGLDDVANGIISQPTSEGSFNPLKYKKDSESEERGIEDIPNGYKNIHGQIVPEYVVDRAWFYDSKRNKWQLLDENQQPYKNRWLPVFTYSKTKRGTNYSWFRFDENGDMVTGWYSDKSGRMFYLEEEVGNYEGELVVGLREINGNTYYFDESSSNNEGVMLTGWFSDKTGNKYYFSKDTEDRYGQMLTGWNYVDNSWKYFSQSEEDKGRLVESKDESDKNRTTSIANTNADESTKKDSENVKLGETNQNESKATSNKLEPKTGNLDVEGTKELEEFRTDGPK